jgi:hypothetical protein
MNHYLNRSFFVLTSFVVATLALQAAEKKDRTPWRQLPLIKDGKVDPGWAHTGWGGFVVDNGTIRTDCDPRGLGLLFYKKERFGNCQIRVVFKTKDTNSNSGVYVRIADGILKQGGQHGPTFERDANGKVTPESMETAKAAADREEGAWYAVHQGFEVQIAGGGDAYHRTGAIYSLAPANGGAAKPGEWQTMVITLAGAKIFVDLDGERITSFDSTSTDLPARKAWHEPKREHRRPESGYIGLQNHDPGDMVWFSEVSIRPVPKAGTASATPGGSRRTSG